MKFNRIAYPDRIWSRVPVERDISLAFHVSIITARVQTPLRGDPLL